MTTSDWVIACAAVSGPILAVQAQKWIERATENRRHRYQVFRTLMVTRGTRLAPDHVASLNSIDLTFAPSALSWLFRGDAKNDKKVVEAWRLYALQLNKTYDKNKQAEFIAWFDKCDTLFVDLLMAMSTAVGFTAERERVQGSYNPSGHYEREQMSLKALENAAKVLAGEQALKMEIVAFPYSQDAIDRQTRLSEEILKAVSGGVVKVDISGGVK